MDNLFVINLESSPQRLREFQRVNAHLGKVERFTAVDGKAADRAALIADKIFEEPITYSNGAIGNALSHLGLWKIAAQKSSPTTVFEDDAIIHKDFENLAPALIAELPPDWDIVVWGWNFNGVAGFDVFPGTPCLAQFSQNEMRQRWEAIQKEPIRLALHRLHYSFGTIGYSLSPAGAKKLLALATPIRPFLYKLPALDLEIQNDAMDCVLLSLYDRLNAYACFPPPVITRNERAASTVQQNEEKAERSLALVPTDFTASRKYKRKQARYLFKNGDIVGGARWYLKYLATSRAGGGR